MIAQIRRSSSATSSGARRSAKRVEAFTDSAGLSSLADGVFKVALPRDIVEGLHFLWRHQILRTFAVMVGGSNFASSATMAVLVLYAVGPGSAMRLSTQVFGVLLAMFAVGSLVGSFVAGRVERALGRRRSIAACFLTGVLSIGLPAVTADPWAIGAAFALGGAGTIISNIIMVSLRQRITPDRLLGRVNSGYRLVAWGSMPLGAAAGGLLAQAFGLRAVFAVMAVVALALLAGMTVVTDDRLDAAERDADVAAAADAQPLENT